MPFLYSDEVDDYNSDVSSIFQGVYKLDLFCFKSEQAYHDTPRWSVLQ